MLYFRYRLDDGRYWGDTNTLDDDPDCGYVTQDTPDYNPMTYIARWTGTDWAIHWILDQGQLGDPV